jgi:hypothetical protein
MMRFHVIATAGFAQMLIPAQAAWRRLVYGAALNPHHRRRRPPSIQDFGLGPVGADVERERAVRRRQPIAFLSVPPRCR